MKRIYMVMCILNTLWFVGCLGPRGPVGVSGPAGIDGHTGEPGKKSVRGDIAILRMSLLELKRSYNANVEGFDLQNGNIDTKVLFEHNMFGNRFKLDNPDNKRNDFYASLKYDIADIKIVEQIIKDFAVGSLRGQVDGTLQSDALSLLPILSDSSWFVRQVISLLEAELATLQQSNDVAGISEINVMLMMMLRQRESVIDDVKERLKSSEPFLSPNIIDFLGVRAMLNPMILAGGKVRAKIYGANMTLRSLKNAIEEKINELKRALVS
ncbi:Hypothetical protein BHO_0025300 (plasmid) [Borrelia hermsii YBT]|uniref:collagen-like triple helix repeat-containing protein n=1 Tax=Borrelia hermsii TaxID=140 RepID=UPI0003E3DC61|nr:collagen-like protein [Borrelia hermsii]AHH13020.1 Hypothetical protein BHO_0025300 [Borrelia hermsii YBT]